MNHLNATENHTNLDTEQTSNDKVYPPKKIVIPSILAIYLAIFLVALDRTIIGTAIPAISNHFNSFGDIAWYESGFLLPLCALQLSFGRVYTHYSAKWVLVSLVFVFELGSIVCASAPNSNALIVGRVLQGVGGAGITTGAFIIINMVLPLQDRPKWTGGIGAVFGLASVAGPLLGGYLTSITWRWCFWLNVPIGGASLATLVFFTPNGPPAIKAAPTWLGKLSQLDPIGFALVVPSVICLLFAIEWGGTTYPWSSGRIIALFVVFGILIIAFMASQVWLGDKATVPPRILLQRNMISAALAMMGIGSVLVIYAFYLPIWFQVIQGKSPQMSGVSLLPLLLSNVVAVMAAGIATSVIGYYTPFMLIGSAVLVVGSGLLTTWSVDTKTGIWVGYQIITGLGLGTVLQGPNIAGQTVLPEEDVSIGLSLLQFINFFSGAAFVTVSQALLENKLISGLKDIIPDLDPSTISGAGATALRHIVSAEELPVVLAVYNDSIRSIWYLGLGLSCLAFVASWGLEWRSVKTKKEVEDRDKA